VPIVFSALTSRFFFLSAFPTDCAVWQGIMSCHLFLSKVSGSKIDEAPLFPCRYIEHPSSHSSTCPTPGDHLTNPAILRACHQARGTPLVGSVFVCLVYSCLVWRRLELGHEVFSFGFPCFIVGFSWAGAARQRYYCSPCSRSLPARLLC